MKITMYELLGMIKDGKAPDKIKYENRIYELTKEKMIWADEIYHVKDMNNITLNFKHLKSMNNLVEIIEDKKIEKLDEFDYNSANEIILRRKINEIIDKINEKEEK